MNKPNILFLMCDQLQERPISSSMCKTPNLDYLASIGTSFKRAYTPNAVCSPARASLMTGLLPHNHGVLCVTHTTDDDQSCIRYDKEHWAQKLVGNGYRTGYFGKWHVERTDEVERYGWQTNGTFSHLGKSSKDWLKDKKHDEVFSLVKYHDQQPGYNSKNLFYGVTNIQPELRGVGIATDAALDFLNDALACDEPWCCFVSINEPHDPFICGEEAFSMYDPSNIELPQNFYDNLDNRPNIYKKAARIWKYMSDQEKKEAVACYYASITEIDEQYGRLIKKVKESGQIDNTIIVFTTDHGELLGAHGLYCKNISACEEVYNIPLIMSGPDIEKGAVSNARIGLHDICPTILELTKSEPINVPDSRSFVSVLSNPYEVDDFQKGYAEYFGSRILLTQRVVWDGDWKFVFNGFDFDELYNLSEDPLEMNNLIDDLSYRDVVKKMTKQMWKKVKETNDHSLYKTHYPIIRLAPYGPMILDE
ncbi:sulfatase-like hydrolase/transferase [Vallitalea guaymasensis]|uniref:sulfatase-like hydrolase/transferase n=1 Tax=Vallitalea guaymasensis TaxID=1185412 RepID=UPI000DE1E585|nr:sulfatase-like hydrolase/transferase [Vallitalea guaymasensis]